MLTWEELESSASSLIQLQVQTLPSAAPVKISLCKASFPWIGYEAFFVGSVFYQQRN